jgi:hypothetical protein
LPDRDVDFVGGDDLASAGRIAVAHFPPPHARRDGHGHPIVRALRHELGAAPRAPDQQDRQHEHGKRDAGAGDPQAGAQRPRMVAQAERHQHHHGKEDQRARREQDPREFGDDVGVRPGRVQDRLQGAVVRPLHRSEYR